MASDARITAAAINAAISSSDYRNAAAPEESKWKGYWTRYWCFKSPRREKQVVPATRVDRAGESTREGPAAQPGVALVPPSSPASFVNSSIQSPARSLAAAAASVCSPEPINTMFTIGPYAHETQLVSPPVFSTFTTEPSTAPFTPPPELAHLTTPSSPDVPFAQYIASSLKAKAVARETISPRSSSTLASPCDTPASYTPTSSLVYLGSGLGEYMSPRSTSNLASPCDTPISYTSTSGQLYLGSPVGHLVLPSLGCGSKDAVLEEGFMIHSSTSSSHTALAFPTFNPFASRGFHHAPALILPADSKVEDPQMSLETGSDSKCSHDDSTLMNESSDLIVTAEPRLESTQVQEEFAGGLLSEQQSYNTHAGDNGGSYESNGRFMTSSMEKFTDGGERVQNLSSSRHDKSENCVCSTSRNHEDIGVFDKGIEDFKTATGSEEVKDVDSNGVMYQSNATFSVKEYVNCIDEGERLQKCVSFGSEKNEGCIPCSPGIMKNGKDVMKI